MRSTASYILERNHKIALLRSATMWKVAIGHRLMLLCAEAAQKATTNTRSTASNKHTADFMMDLLRRDTEWSVAVGQRLM